MTDNNTITMKTCKTRNQLFKLLAGLTECRRMGFVSEDEKGVLSLSNAGYAYLMSVVARDITDPAEAFAAGYQAAFDEMKPDCTGKAPSSSKKNGSRGHREPSRNAIEPNYPVGCLA